MLIHDDIYNWEGWGGKLRLASGKCRLRIFDRTPAKGGKKPITYLRPVIVVVSDVPDSKMTVRSCAGHVATSVAADFKIDPHRMLWVEYYPTVQYGKKNEYVIPEQYVAVDFTWNEERAVHPKWRQLKPPMLEVVKTLMKTVKDKSV